MSSSIFIIAKESHNQLRNLVCFPVATSSLLCLLRNSTVRKASVRPSLTVSASMSNVSPLFAALRNLEIHPGCVTRPVHDAALTIRSIRWTQTWPVCVHGSREPRSIRCPSMQKSFRHVTYLIKTYNSNQDKQTLSFSYHYDSNGVRQYRVRIEYGLAFEMRRLGSDARKLEMDSWSIADLLHRKFD